MCFLCEDTETSLGVQATLSVSPGEENVPGLQEQDSWGSMNITHKGPTLAKAQQVQMEDGTV